jgi:hypothetical protein
MCAVNNAVQDRVPNCVVAEGAVFLWPMVAKTQDRHPYPVPLKVYHRTIDVLKVAVHRARLGQSEKLAAIRRLDNRRVGSSGTSPGLQSRRCSRGSVRARINMAVEAYLAPSCRPLRPHDQQESASGEVRRHW